MTKFPVQSQVNQSFINAQRVESVIAELLAVVSLPSPKFYRVTLRTDYKMVFLRFDRKYTRHFSVCSTNVDNIYRRVEEERRREKKNVVVNSYINMPYRWNECNNKLARTSHANLAAPPTFLVGLSARCSSLPIAVVSVKLVLTVLCCALCMSHMLKQIAADGVASGRWQVNRNMYEFIRIA